ncbi:MAG: M48 family peptidase [Dehalococcoidia bacterium]|nr:M48 family peptidase [Dehalococcoidia bacterium]
MAASHCAFQKPTGEPCLAPPLRDSPYCLMHSPEHAAEWGNCSAHRNLSFNWRLILAPDFVLRYMVTHEAVHLAVPDHSAKFWLTVHSLCPETERAKQWLSANGQHLLEPLLSSIVTGSLPNK